MASYLLMCATIVSRGAREKAETPLSSSSTLVTNAEFVWYEIVRVFNFVSFCCRVFIQLLACNPKPGVTLPPEACFDLCRVCESNTCSISSALQHDGFLATHLTLFLFSPPGANPKKPSAPDMFTESDDMFAADFDVSHGVTSCLCHCQVHIQTEWKSSWDGVTLTASPGSRVQNSQFDHSKVLVNKKI